MKKVLWLIVCLMTMVLSVNAQKADLMRVRQAAVNYHKTTLKAPSTFILTDAYGNKLPMASIKPTFIKGKTETYEKRPDVCNEKETIYDAEINENCWYSHISCQYNHYPSDTLNTYEKVYADVWEVSFIGESQNSYGGMVSNHHKYYVDKNYEVYESIPFEKKVVSKKYSPIERCCVIDCKKENRCDGYCTKHCKNKNHHHLIF